MLRRRAFYTASTATFSITTSSIIDLSVTFSISIKSHYISISVTMQHVVMLSVVFYFMVTLNVIMLSFVSPQCLVHWSVMHKGGCASGVGWISPAELKRCLVFQDDICTWSCSSPDSPASWSNGSNTSSKVIIWKADWMSSIWGQYHKTFQNSNLHFGIIINKRVWLWEMIILSIFHHFTVRLFYNWRNPIFIERL